MTTLLLLAAVAWYWTPPTPDLPAGLVPAIVHVESRGHTMARNACCSGFMQVARRYARVPSWALHVPAIGRLEGVRHPASVASAMRRGHRVRPAGLRHRKPRAAGSTTRAALRSRRPAEGEPMNQHAGHHQTTTNPSSAGTE